MVKCEFVTDLKFVDRKVVWVRLPPVRGFDRHAGAALKAARGGRHRPSASRESARTGLVQSA